MPFLGVEILSKLKCIRDGNQERGTNKRDVSSSIQLRQLSISSSPETGVSVFVEESIATQRKSSPGKSVKGFLISEVRVRRCLCLLEKK